MARGMNQSDRHGNHQFWRQSEHELHPKPGQSRLAGVRACALPQQNKWVPRNDNEKQGLVDNQSQVSKDLTGETVEKVYGVI